MNYHVDRTAQLENAVKQGYGAQAAQLRAAGTPTRQHNVKVSKGYKPAKKAAKKSKSPKVVAKKTAAKPNKKS